MKETLTQRGINVISSLLIFFLITNLSAAPIFSVTSSVLFFIFAAEAIKFRLACKSLASIRVTRHFDSEFIFIGESLNVRFEVHYKGSKVGAIINLRDLVPYGLEVTDGSNILIKEMEGSGNIMTTYTIKAAEFGKKTYEGIEVLLFDRLGLFVTRRKLICKSSLKIYPRIPIIQIETLKKPNPALRYSEKGSSRRSIGTEFTGIREYIPGDDHRMVAWKAMAKSPTLSPMTKDYQQLKMLDIFIVFLAKSSMRDGPLGQRKIDKAVDASLTLANQAFKMGYSISFIFPHNSGFMLASGSLIQLAASVAEMDIMEASESQFSEFFKLHVKKKSLLLVITDLPYPETINLPVFQFIKLEGHVVFFILLQTPSFLARSEEKENSLVRLVVDVLDRIEDNHMKSFILDCTNIGIRTFICTPKDLPTIMLDVFSEARMMYLP